MGIYIKGMEMPNCCLDCPLYNGHGCKATLQMFHPTTNVAVRVDGCPLVEVKTSHGRLVDESEIHTGIRMEKNTEHRYFIDKVNAPTVIEAEAE